MRVPNTNDLAPLQDAYEQKPISQGLKSRN